MVAVSMTATTISCSVPAGWISSSSFCNTARVAAVLDWADGLLKEYPARRGIVVSHSILNTGNPATWTTKVQNIFNALKDNPNLFLMLCGHISGEGRRVDTGTNGNTIYSLLADYQSEPQTAATDFCASWSLTRPPTRST